VAATSENVWASLGCCFSKESLYGTYDRTGFGVRINYYDIDKSPICLASRCQAASRPEIWCAFRC